MFVTKTISYFIKKQHNNQNYDYFTWITMEFYVYLCQYLITVETVPMNINKCAIFCKENIKYFFCVLA